MIEPELVTLEEAPTAVIRGTVPMDRLGTFFDGAFGRLPRAITEQGARVVGPAFARYFGPPGDTVELEVGFPTDRPVDDSGDVVASSLPAGRAARLVHEGSYDGLSASWERLGTWVQQQGLVGDGAFWEVYVTEPSPDMDPAELRTELTWPVR